MLMRAESSSPGRGFPDAPGNLAEKAGAVLERTAIGTGAVIRRQEFMPEITVRVFDVDEIESGFLRDDRRLDEMPDDLPDLLVRHDIRGVVAEFFIQKRMRICGFGLQHTGLFGWE